MSPKFPFRFRSVMTPTEDSLIAEAEGYIEYPYQPEEATMTHPMTDIPTNLDYVWGGTSLRWERLEEINRDMSYQRAPKMAKVNLIVAQFDIRRFGTALVAERFDRSLFVVDANHRLCAADKLGLEYVPCTVFRSTGAAEEAEIFRVQDLNKTRVSTLDKFNAGLTAGDIDCQALRDITKANGFEIGHSSSVRTLDCVSTLEDLYEDNLLDVVLASINEFGWVGQHHGTHNKLMKGLGYFINVGGDRIDWTRLTNKMRAQLPVHINRSYDAGNGVVVDFALGVAANIAKAYNHNLGASKRIEVLHHVG